MIKPLFQRIVVAYHSSESSRRALMYAIMMAKVYKCNVKVVFVIDTATIKFLTLSKFMVQEEGEMLSEKLEGDAKRNFDFVVKLAKTKGVKVETEVRHGAVWSEVISAADDYKANLILLGGTVESDSKWDVISSHDSQILAHAHCSVLVVRDSYIEQLFKLA